MQLSHRDYEEIFYLHLSIVPKVSGYTLGQISATSWSKKFDDVLC